MYRGRHVRPSLVIAAGAIVAGTLSLVAQTPSASSTQAPAQIAFDGNGRMFVLELRGYMQDADATGELDPVGRISVHEDRDNDGVYETHRVFVDHLVFPRFVMPLGANAILAKESNADEVWKFTDTNGDGVADKKELFATGMGRLLNVEHQESGLFWALDAVGGGRGRGAGPNAAPAAPPPLGYPRGYRVQVSMDGTTWGSSVAEGAGTGPATRITFAPVRAKFVRITETATTEGAPPWTIQRLRLYEPGAVTEGATR